MIKLVTISLHHNGIDYEYYEAYEGNEFLGTYDNFRDFAEDYPDIKVSDCEVIM